jgi:hypothetical protein
MKIFHSRPPSQEVDSSLTELSGARSCEKKSDAPLFNQAVDLIEQGGQSLDLIDDHDAIFRCEFFSEALGALIET